MPKMQFMHAMDTTMKDIVCVSSFRAAESEDLAERFFPDEEQVLVFAVRRLVALNIA
jgi:hypothetical protein